MGDADWSPDGTTLIFTAPPFPGTGSRQLFRWSLGESAPTVIWTCPQVDCLASSPSWSPDGRSIVLNANTRNYNDSRLVILDADGTNERQIQPQGLRAVGFPSWTPDGLILFTAYWETDIRLAEIRPDGSGFRTLSDTAYPNGVVAAMSPDGQSIALLVDSFDPSVASPTPASPTSHNGIELWIENSDGTNARQIWYRPGCCISLGFGGPEWSPDGAKVAIVAIASPGPSDALAADIQLLSFDVGSGQATELGRADPAQPAWQPVR
jgi:Tol biopolymer transport system component